MKRRSKIIGLCILVVSTLSAQQTSWQWINPLPQGNILNAVFAINQDTVYSVADHGTVISTTNGGKTWQVIPAAAGMTDALYAVHFVNSSTGWAFGETGRIVKTTDAGKTWFVQEQPYWRDLFAAEFVSPTTGWAAGLQGTIIKTTDGGNSWTSQASGVTSSLYGMNFLNASTGWLAGTGGKILKTTNGGATWEVKTSGTVQNLYGVQFISGSVGFAVGSFGLMIKSTDGGETWIPQISGTDFSLYGLRFVSALTGWAVGSYGVTLKTTNGGLSWFQQNSRTYDDLFSLSFSSSATGWAVGDYGRINFTTDGGATWTAQSSGVKNILNGISFPTGLIGIAVGEEGTIVRSTDGGTSWTERESGTLQILWGVHMVNKDIGWAVGDSAIILKTTNGGFTWTGTNSRSEESLYSVYFASTTHGWTVGDFGTVLATTNGGTTWKPETTNTYNSLLKIKFLNLSVGWTVGYGGLIFKTTNGGNTWFQQTSGTTKALYDIEIIDANTVHAFGDFGITVSTTNGGNTWSSLTIDNWTSFYGSAFASSLVGWAAGDDGVIAKTSNGGLSWELQPSGTENTLWDIQFVPSVNGGGTLFAAGYGGTLLYSGNTPLNRRTWTGSYDSMWTSPGNWDPVGTPEKGDSVSIPLTGKRPVYRGIAQQVNLAALGIAPGASLKIESGLAQLVVSGNIKIDGTLELDPASTIRIIAGDNFGFGTNGSLSPARSTVIINSSGQIRGPFYDLFINDFAEVRSIGNIEIKNNLTIGPGLADTVESIMTMRPSDTLTISNGNPEGFQGKGIIDRGTIKRAIRNDSFSDYRFESPVTYVRFYPAGTIPDTLLMTVYPNTPAPGLSDTVFVKRYYNISAIGGADYLSFLSLRYNNAETSIPIEDLGLFRDSNGIIVNMGVTDYLDSDLVAIDLDSVRGFSNWYIGKYDYFWTHPFQFTDTLIVNDNGLISDTLFFGTAPGATDGIDPHFSEVQLSPKPPPGTFDVRWNIPATNGSIVDIRDLLSYTHQQIIYTGSIQPGGGGYPVTLRWDNAIFPFGAFYIRDGATQGSLFQIDMRSQSTVVISNPSITSFQIVNTAPEYYTFRQGWNMISLPVIPWNDNRKTTIFPTAVSGAFGYSNTYYATDTLTHRAGYWLKFAAQEQVPLDGVNILTDTIPVTEGWNMIGSISEPVSTNGVIQQPSGIVISDYYFFDRGYISTDSVRPAKGYWVKTNKPGNLILAASPSAAPLAVGKNSDDRLGLLNTITITDGDGCRQTLYFGNVEDSGLSADRYELPPPPPGEIFDARWASDSRIEIFRGKPETGRIDIRTSAYPLTIGWNIKQEQYRYLQITDAATGNILSKGIYSREGTVRISESSVSSLIIKGERTDEVPSEFALKQNYPNPFNPSTTMEFSLPTDAKVTLKIYDILGQEIAVLIDGKSVGAGTHRVEFNPIFQSDGSGFSSGVYLYRISAQSRSGSYVDVKKMLFLK